MEKGWMLNNFNQIESKIEHLVTICEKYEERNAELEKKAAFLEEELKKRIEEENLYSEQKAMVRKRIDGLLMKLDNYSNHKG